MLNGKTGPTLFWSSLKKHKLVNCESSRREWGKHVRYGNLQSAQVVRRCTCCPQPGPSPSRFPLLLPPLTPPPTPTLPPCYFQLPLSHYDLVLIYFLYHLPMPPSPSPSTSSRAPCTNASSHLLCVKSMFVCCFLCLRLGLCLQWSHVLLLVQLKSSVFRCRLLFCFSYSSKVLFFSVGFCFASRTAQRFCFSV